jgi:hypothetical protein
MLLFAGRGSAQPVLAFSKANLAGGFGKILSVAADAQLRGTPVA